MNRVILFGLLICAAAALQPWDKFFGDYFERWLNNPETVINPPWFVWTRLAISSISAAFITLVAYITNSHHTGDKPPEEKK